MNETEFIKLVPDKQCRRDLDPNDERSDMWWVRLQRRYPDIFPPKIKIGRINHRERDLWEKFKQHLISVAASAAPDERDVRNLEHGRKMGREAKMARGK
ncbi:hypothetical protein JQ607_02840 [Bradyrhizobium liaoningense]|uniref:hypothetical protein n=1 Tax=Bradyrhizobium liaoningense TaxID=43992 RepID=UPI001BAC4335|nr:hypothetical protein [Bradyrhizobium liaoningense]MBR0839120.1 hypothetical protein [Bradyrhizobium liaoningense]